MFGIRKTFRRLFGRSAADAFNAVVAYLNNLCGDESIDFHRPDSPSAENPPCVAVNKTWLESFIDQNTDGAEWASGATKASVLVGTNAAGELTNIANLVTSQNSNWDRMLVVGKGGTTVSWKNVRAEEPDSTLTLVSGTNTSTTAQGAAHTVADTGTNAAKGFVLPVVTRTVWDGSKIYNFYTTLTFDKYGRLYSLSKEARVTIDTPTKVVWS